ncbi:MAG: hypothetical protein KJO61_01995, partial [Deltaproteobacteria bacterium]|nr:hypothetical protein [Deltaproteobacteria bacterium]
KECTASRYQVFKDFLYIFFKLKDFPDYYSQFRWWDVDRSEWKYYYGSFYNPLQRGKLRKRVQRKEYEILFADKYVCYQLCQSAKLPTPDIFAYIKPDDNYRSSIDTYTRQHRKVIIKSTSGSGGKDIFLAFLHKGKIIISDGDNLVDLNIFKLTHESILQKYVIQHDSMSQVSNSVNTIRIETMLTLENDVLLLGAFLRFGLDAAITDNQCCGGLSIGVDIPSGRLKEYALNGRGEKFFAHPNSNFRFEAFKIPFWDEVVELSKQIQFSFPYYKILGPDIAITPNGPIIIEINGNPDHAGLEMDYGPTLKDPRIRKEFHRYDLLINKLIKSEL